MSRFNFHDHLLRRDHTLNGGILFGIDGHNIELQGRATKVLRSPKPVAECVQVTGMTRGPVIEAVTRISGAFSKLGMPPSPVEILINLAPAALEKGGAWLDLPMAVLMLQVAGYFLIFRKTMNKSFSSLVKLAFLGNSTKPPAPHPNNHPFDR